MGKRWWRKALGVSNSQRQLSRKLGFPLSGRRGKGCALLLIIAATGILIALV